MAKFIQKYKIFIIGLILLNWQSVYIFSQNTTISETNSNMTQYYYISVCFYSIGQGIHVQAHDNFLKTKEQLQKKFNATIPFEKIYWGKEGEMTYYLDLSNLQGNASQNLLNELYEISRDRNNIAIVQANLIYDPNQQVLILGIMLNGQNKSREDAVIKYVDEFEKKNKLKLNNGYMINETGIVEDQDKRYQFNLKQLSPNQNIEFIAKIRDLMKVSKQ